jgi:hypothetical protein
MKMGLRATKGKMLKNSISYAFELAYIKIGGSYGELL